MTKCPEKGVLLVVNKLVCEANPYQIRVKAQALTKMIYTLPVFFRDLKEVKHNQAAEQPRRLFY